MSLNVEQRLAIHEMLGLYGHLIDDRAWERFGEVFLPTVRYVAEDFGLPTTNSLAELIELWQQPDAPHPVAHHTTNIVVVQEADGTVRVRSKGIGVGAKGRVGSVTYDDIVVETPDGWRLAERIVTQRRASA